MKHVFISYSHEDYDDFVKKFINDLLNEKILVWIDEKGVPPGTPDWEEAIRKAIKDAQAVILVATVNSRKSPFVRSELSVAQMESITIYPVWARGDNGRYADCIPLGYFSWQMLDMRDENYDDAFIKLIKTLRGDDYHPLLDKTKQMAREWDDEGRPDYLLWRWEQQAPVYEIIEQLQLDLDETTQAFLIPEYVRLFEQFKTAPHYRQQTIIERWQEIGEPCLEAMMNCLAHIKYTYQINGVDNQVLDSLILALKPYAFELLPTIISCLTDENFSVRFGTIVVLEHLDANQGIDPLITALNDRNGVVRGRAIQALCQIGEERAINAISNLLTDTEQPPNYEIGIFGYAANALVQFATPEAIAVIGHWQEERPDLYQEWKSWKSPDDKFTYR